MNHDILNILDNISIGMQKAKCKVAIVTRRSVTLDLLPLSPWIGPGFTAFMTDAVTAWIYPLTISHISLTNVINASDITFSTTVLGHLECTAATATYTASATNVIYIRIGIKITTLTAFKI